MKINYMFGKFNFAKSVVFVFAVLACIGMWGCGGDVEWNEGFGGNEVIGFVDDSLVIVYDSQGWPQKVVFTLGTVFAMEFTLSENQPFL